MRHFIQYWKSVEADRVKGHLLVRSASGQFHRIGLAKDDVLWIVTIRDGRLKLVGQLVVDRVVDKRTAERMFPDANLYDAAFYALADSRSVVTASEIDIQELTHTLRFNSSTSELMVFEDTVDGRQLQTIREIDPTCISLLESKLVPKYPSLVSLLESWGFDVANTLNRRMKVVRHTNASFSIKDLYKRGIEDLETYQNYQKKPIFDNCAYIVSFIGEDGDRASSSASTKGFRRMSKAKIRAL